MIKDQRINDFFNVFKSLKIQNPGIQLNQNTLYSALIRFGVFSNDKDILTRNERFDKIVKKDGNFNKWVTRFRNSKNTFVHVDANWDFFCQFEHGISRNNIDDFIKIYVPLINSRIQEGVNRIFDFTDKMGIEHLSKVSADIRFDDVVIRVKRKEDADAIINFINNDPYIREGLIPANPFAFNKDGIAIVSDGNSSYNSILSTLLTEFINKTDTEKLNSFNFYSYLSRLQFNIDSNYIDLETYVLTTFQGNKPRMKDFKRVLDLIIDSHKPNFTYDDYINHFYNGLDNNFDKDLNIEYVLFDAIKIMSSKHGIEPTISALNEFVNTGDKNKITRLNGLRAKLVNSNFRNSITNLMNSSNLSFSALCYLTLNKYQNNYNNYENEKRARI